MMRSKKICNQNLSTLTKEENKEIKDSKHSPVYRRRGVEGFTPLFSFLFVYLGKAIYSMKLSFKILLICLGFFSISMKAHTQDVRPVIDFALVDPDNPLLAYDTCAIIVHVKLTSCDTDVDTGATSGYLGNLKYYLQSDKMGQHIPEIDPFEIDNDTALENMPATGKFDTLWFYVDTTLFRTTSVNPVNVIIIWPAFTNLARPMCDSSETILWNVPGYVGIDDALQQGYGSTVYPNPAAPMQIVFINSKYAQEISQVTIVNAMGQVMNTKQFMENESSQGYVLPTENLRPGIYNIHIFYKDKKNEVVKFVKN